MTTQTHTEANTTATQRRIHGGAGHTGHTAASQMIRWDFSTNTNALGAYPALVTALQRLSDTQWHSYPDQHYTALREQLAQLHNVSPERILITASGSEAIARITTAFAMLNPSGTVQLPRHSYGDYAHHARVHRLHVPANNATDSIATENTATENTNATDPSSNNTNNTTKLHWLAYPSSPLGQCPALPNTLPDHTIAVLDCAYAPLQLSGKTIAPQPPSQPRPQLQSQPARSYPSNHLDNWWQLWTPNKALGACGIRGAYLIAPANHATSPLHQPLYQLLHALAPSWAVGATGHTMLSIWSKPSTHQWLHDGKETLKTWKLAQRIALDNLGWTALPSSTSFFCALAPAGVSVQRVCHHLAQHGVQVRDCTSFGLPHAIRTSVQPPSVFVQLQRLLLHLPHRLSHGVNDTNMT